ncbi:MAG: GNAT family N-acetyltransferase [Prevotella sp.]
MMSHKIELATPQDTEAIIQFQLAMASETEGITLDYETVREGVKAAIADDSKALYLLAKNEEGQVIGSLMLTTEWSDWNNGVYYWIQSVYVRPDDRKQGVFSELFELAKSIAQSQNAGALRLYVDEHNLVAQKVYQSLGMHPSHYLMYEL